MKAYDVTRAGYSTNLLLGQTDIVRSIKYITNVMNTGMNCRNYVIKLF